MANPNCPDCSNPCCVTACVEFLECVLSCECCCAIGVNLAPNLDLKAGTILAQRNSDGLFVPFDISGTDGSQIPKGVLKYNTVTDANGHNLSTSGVLGICPQYETLMYICGTFRLEETHGNLEAALNYPSFGRLLTGFVGGSGIWKLL